MTGSVLMSAGLIVAMAQGATDQRKNWRGIVPLKSTRADVEQLLGPPPPPPKDGTWLYTPGKFSSLYFFEDEDVRISYMTDEAAKRKSCSAIPIDTVTGILVSFKKHPPLSYLNVEESKFETFDPSSPPNIGFKAYVDIIDGMYICTLDGKVNDIVYYGDARDRQVCPALNGDPKQFCNILVDFYKPKKPNND